MIDAAKSGRHIVDESHPKKIHSGVDKTELLYYCISTVKRELIDQLDIDFASPLPVYEQVTRGIKQAVARRTLASGEALPSIREMASFLKINPNTVARAYRELLHQGIVNGRAGKGYWVESGNDPSQGTENMVKELFLEFIHKAVEMGYSREDLQHLVQEFFRERES